MKYFKILLFAVGAWVAADLGRQVGWSTLWDQLLLFRWKLVLIVALIIPKNIIFTYVWDMWLKARNHYQPFWTLFRFKVMESAVNSMSPLHVVGGDLIRITLLKEHMPLKDASCAVLLDRLSQVVSGILLVLISLVFAFGMYPQLHPIFWAGLGIFGAVMGAGTALFCFRNRFYSFWKFQWVRKLNSLDDEMWTFLKSHKGLFAKTTLLTLVGRFFSPLEIFLILFFFHFTGPNAVFSLVLSGASNFITTIFTFVPGQLGVMEGSFTLLFKLAGFSVALGMACQLIRRINALVWISIGTVMLLMGRRQTAIVAAAAPKSPQTVPSSVSVPQ